MTTFGRGWYVRYPDGFRSIGMRLSLARSYCRMFAGRVYCERTHWLARWFGEPPVTGTRT